MKTKKERIKAARHKEALLLFQDLLSDDQRVEAGLIDLSATNDAKAEELMKSKYEDDFDIVSLMAGAEDPDTGLIRDLKIDDRDLKSAQNFWDFSYNILGKDAKPPWMIQMWIGIVLLAEYCPCCSDKRWLDLSYVVEKVGKGTSSEVLPNHMQLLNNGTCLHGDSLLLTSGGMVKIRDLVPDKTKLGLFPKAGRVLTSQGVQSLSYAGLTRREAECLEVMTSNGSRLVCTPDHPVMVLGDDFSLQYKEAQTLTSTDYLVHVVGEEVFSKKAPALPKGFQPTFTNNATQAVLINQPKVVTPELARLTGYLLTDGTFGGSVSGLRFTNSDKGLVNDFVKCLRSIFPEADPLCDARGLSRVTGGYKPYWELRFNRKVAADYLEHLGLKRGTFDTKEVPGYILTSPRHLQLEFLRACFDCDGFVGHRKIGISLANPELVRTLSQMLANFGIYGTIVYGRTSNGNPSATYRVLAEYRQIFATTFGTLNTQRLADIEDLKSLPVRYTRTNRNTGNLKPGALPNGRRLYRALLKGAGLLGASSSQSSLSARSDSYLISEVLADPLLIKSPQLASNLRLLAKGNFAYSRVTTVIPFGKHDVYDLTVPKTSNFTANGMLVHNCPKCKRHKHELIKKHGLHNYQELVNVLGQRSGKSSSAAAGYSPYIVHRYLKFPRLATMTNSMQNSTELTGTFVSLTFSKAASVLWTPFVNVIDESRWFCLAEGTSISLADGSKQNIELVPPGALVKTFEGVQPVLKAFNNGIQECFNVELSTGQVLPGTAEHQVQCLGPDAISLVWKNIKDLTEQDFVVVE